MKFLTIASLVWLGLAATLNAQNNAVPLVYPSLSPVSAAQGGSGFTLTVNGTGFATGAVVRWNGSARSTTVVSGRVLEAAISSADISHRGTASITVTNPAPGGGVSKVVYFPVRPKFNAAAFAPEPGISTATGPIAVGDFNRDGRPDLVVAENSSRSSIFSFYRGLGDGTFSPAVTTASNFPIGYLIAGDFNGDGKLDLFAGSSGNGEGGIATGLTFLGNGAGHFMQHEDFSGGGDFPGAAAATADLNGDGILDIVYTGEIGGQYTMFIHLGNGDGSFTRKTSMDIGFTEGATDIGDFNHDGKVDLAVQSTLNGGGVSIFLGNGDGTFHSASSLPGSGSPVVADINGDGNLDVLTEKSVLLGDGTGGFTVLSAQLATPMTLGDFNADGKLDVAGFEDGDTSSLELFLGNADGTFQPATSFGFSLTQSFAFALPMADFNRDGLLDVATSGPTATLIGLQTNLGVSPSRISFGSHKIGTTSKTQTITLTNVGVTGVPITSITVTGSNPGDFPDQNHCGAVLASGHNCTVLVAFKPTVTGSRSASISISYSGVDTPQTVTLLGFGFN
jgi:hypothetical protein